MRSKVRQPLNLYSGNRQTNRQTKPIIHLKNQTNIRQDNVHPMKTGQGDNIFNFNKHFY